MLWITAFLVAVLFGLATWMLLHRNWLRIVMGVILLGHGANLALLASSGNPSGKHPPITNSGFEMTDPLPQALLLTAIVISFAVLAYFLTLVFRMVRDSGSQSLDELFSPEP